MPDLYLHPFASFCQKVIVAFHELGVPFGVRLVEDRTELLAHWPLGGMPVLRDDAQDLTIPESTSIIEYADAVLAAAPRLVPADAAAARAVRHWDRFFDVHVEVPMQKIVGDSLRPEDGHDPIGVEQARATLQTAYGVADAHLATAGTWACGETFTMADCAAAPALFYARIVEPWDAGAVPHLDAYFTRLRARPSFARVVDDARPHRALFPLPWPAGND
jgi:glutathione S-transferase